MSVREMKRDIQLRKTFVQKICTHFLTIIVLFILIIGFQPSELKAQLITLPKKTDTKPAPAPKKTNTPSVSQRQLIKLKKTKKTNLLLKIISAI